MQIYKKTRAQLKGDKYSSKDDALYRNVITHVLNLDAFPDLWAQEDFRFKIREPQRVVKTLRALSSCIF